MSEDKVIPLVAFQEAYSRRRVCIDCGYQDSGYIAVKIKAENIKCSGCGQIGHMIYWEHIGKWVS